MDVMADLKADLSPVALYRHYDSSGKLLYVGIAVAPIGRLQAHGDRSAWFPDIASVTIEWHQNREAALDAEALAIHLEGPEFNRSTAQSRRLRVFCPRAMWPEKPKTERLPPNLLKTPAEILTFVGSERARERLEVTQDRIRIAMTQDILPSSWYAVLEDLAGRPLPRECFNFKGRT